MVRRFRNFDDDKRRYKRIPNLGKWFSKGGIFECEEFIVYPRAQIANQKKDIKLVKEYTKNLRMELKNFQTNSKLELYFDIYRDKKDICYIAKGWGDPGFRIGEFVMLNKAASHFKEKFYEIFKICSKNLISVEISEQAGAEICLSLEIGIYQDGFTEKVLKEAIKTLEDALKAIHKLIDRYL